MRLCFSILHSLWFTYLSVATATIAPNTTFRIGVLGPVTSVSQSFLAVVVLFDLDFRKNFNASLVERFGPPIVEVPDLNPNLRIHPILGTSGPDGSGLGMETLLDWLLPQNNEPTVDGIAGGLDSQMTGWALGLTSHLRTSQIAWRATDSRLSDRNQYPYFARTVPSDAAQGLAVWVWMEHFSVPTVVYLYASADLGERVFQVTADLGQDVAGKVHGVAALVTISAQNSSDTSLYLDQVRATGSRFLMLALPTSLMASLWPAMEVAGMLYNGAYQLLAFTWFELQVSLPLGFKQFHFTSAGSKFELLEFMWRQLEVEDIYGDEARERYRFNEMKESLHNGSAPLLTEPDLSTTVAIDPQVSFMFDACYTFVLAFNHLSNEGRARDNIAVDEIWDAIRSTSFEGVSGKVEFDFLGERSGAYTLVNARVSNSSSQELVNIGTYDAMVRALALQQSPVWVTGEERATLPSALLNCTSGFETSLTTGLCTPCHPGSGCGHRPQDGFPVGVFGPFTSLSQEWLAAAVLVDLDIQKASDPSLVETFGPPIVEIPNVHPDFRLKVQLGTSDSEVEIGMDTTLDWFLGRGLAYKTAAVCGGYHSSIASPVASNAAVFETPQILWGATSASLSDRTLYPWISRVIAPDNLQVEAVWQWIEYFQIPVVVVLYARELFSQGLFQGLSELATAAGQSSRILGIGMAVQLGEGFDMDITLDSLELVRNTGIKVIVSFASDRTSAFGILSALNTTGMAESYQVLGADSLARQSTGLLKGLHWILQISYGSNFSRFLDMWHLMTPDDVYGAVAQERYLYDSFRVHPSEAAARLLVEEDFLLEPDLFAGFILDSVYIVALAINSLLNANVTPQEIKGVRLLDEIRRTSFEGVTGFVSLDGNFDRAGDYALYNVMSGGVFTQVAQWSARTGELSFQDGIEMVWMTGSIGSLAPDELIACAPGQQWDATTRLCIWCPANWFSLGGVREGAKCSPCAAGNVSTVPLGATGCMTCPSGTYRTIADEQCIPCPLGTFGSSPGQSECINCPVGMFSAQEGMQECEACGSNSSVPELFTTMARVNVNGITQFSYVTGATSSDMCGCDRNSRNTSNGECVSCGVGVECRGMGDVRIKPGYFAEEIIDGQLSVFRCHTDVSHCIGGVPGATCAAGRTGTVCAECEQFKTPSQSGGCEECGTNDTAPFIATILCGCVVLVVIYCVIDSSERVGQSQSLVLCGIACGQLVTLIQQLGAVGNLLVRWEEPMKTTLRLLGLLAFDLEILRINCVKSQVPLERFIVKVCIIFFTVGYMFLVHFTIVGVRYGRRKMRYKRAKSLIGAVGLLFMIFYISVATTVLEPFQCQSHPNGKWTMHSYPSTVCWETAEHQAMLAIGVAAFFAVPVAFLAGATYAVLQLPKRMRKGDTAFLRATSFLFVRYRPGKHAFVIVQLLRSLFMAVVLVIPDLALEIASLQLVLLVGYSFSLHLLPFRVPTANFLDCVFGASTLGVVCLVAFFIEDDQVNHGGLSWLTFSIVTLILTIAPIVACGAFLNFMFRFRKAFQYFLCHHKQSCGAYTRLLKMSLGDSPRIRQEVFLDSDNLDNLDRLFDYVAYEVGTLIAIVSDLIFTRPWCMGEICTAKVKKVPTLLVALPSAVFPDKRFIEEVEQRIDGLDVLTIHGIGLEILCDTLRWIPSQLTIKVPTCVTLEIMSTLVDRIVANDPIEVKSEGQLSSFRLVISADTDTTLNSNTMMFDGLNMEAAATAYILRKLLLPLMSHKIGLIPSCEFYPAAGVILVICTTGLLESAETHEALLQVAEVQGCSFLPLLSDQTFRFPTVEFGQHLRVHSHRMSETEVAIVGFIVGRIFTEIAITFAAQHAGQSHLELAANEISQRLLNRARSFASNAPDAARTPTEAFGSGRDYGGCTEDLEMESADALALTHQDSLKAAPESEKNINNNLEEMLGEAEELSLQRLQSEASSDISCWLAFQT